MRSYFRSRGSRLRSISPAVLDSCAGQCERLESRVLLDAVFWDGGAGTTSWHDAANWSRNGADALPQNGDDVTISVAANPTILYMSGSITLASLTTDEAITVSGGMLGLTGAADVNAALTLNGGAIQGGTWDVTGGLLTAGANVNSTLNGVTVNGDLTMGTGARARIQNGITFANAANRIRFTGTGGQQLGFVGGGSLLTGGVSFEGTSGTSDIGAIGNNVLTIGPGVSITGGRGRIGQNLFGSGNAGLTVQGSVLANVPGAGITMTTGGTGVLTIAGAGSVGAAGANAALTIDPNLAAWSSAGAINAGAGAVVNFEGAWSSTGMIGVNGGTLNLDGTFSYSSLASGFSRSGGAVNIVGVMNNEGMTVALSAATGDWVLSGGTIMGGAAGGSIAQDGASLLFTSSTSNTLNRQTIVSGDLVLSTGQALRVVNGVAFAATGTQRIRMGGAGNNRLGFAGDFTLPVDVLFEATAGTSQVGTIGDGTLTIPAGVTVSGGRGAIGLLQFVNGDTTLINNGAVVANVTGTTLTLDASNAGVVRNMGTVSAVNGATLTVNKLSGDLAGVSASGAASTVNLNGSFVLRSVLEVDAGTTISINAGATSVWLAGVGGGFDVQGGTLNLGGTFATASVSNFTRAGGTVNIVGVLNNEAQALVLNAATGSWNLNGGTISGGTAGGVLRFVDGAALNFTSNASNALDRQTSENDIALGTGASLRIMNGLTFANAALRFRLGGAGGNRIGFMGDALLATGGIVFENTSGTSDVGPVANATLTIGAGVIVSGARGRLGLTQFGAGNGNTVIAGVVVANVGGQTLTLQASGTGTISVAGQLSATSGSTLAASDLVGTLNNASAGGAGSVVNLTGSFTVAGQLLATNGGVISVNPGNATTPWDLDSVGLFDVQNGTLNLGGRFTLAGDAKHRRIGGSVNITGVLVNEGQEITLDASTGSWNLGGGAIDGGALGGTLRFRDGATLTFNINNANTLSRQSIDGDLVVGSGGSLRISNGVVFLNAADRLRLAGTGGNIVAFVGDTTLATGGIVFEASAGLSDVGLVGSGTLTIGAGVIVSGGRGRLGLTHFVPGTTNVVNNGIIDASVAGQSLTIDTAVGAFTNNLIVRASAGGRLTVTGDTPISNLVAGTLSGGTWIASGTSVMNLMSALITTNNATVGVGAIGSFPALATLSVNNGTLRTTGGGAFIIAPAGGTLMNNGVVILEPGNVLNVTGNFAQARFGTLQVQFQGPGAADIGLLAVSGTAALDGSLTSTPVNGFTPSCQNSVFISAASISGGFASQILYRPAGAFQSFTLVNGGEMRLVIESIADYNQDGLLNGQDVFDFFEDFFNNDADYNGDGMTNTQDFFDFIMDFFNGCP